MSQEEDDAENALVAELRALAGGPEGDRFVISRRGRSITVTHNSGSTSSLTLRASYDAAARADQGLVAPRPLDIVLRSDAPHELPTAYRTGDARFDGAVFVDTPTTNQQVLAVVLDAEVRAAVLALFALDFHRVTIDTQCALDGADVVEAYLWTFASSEPPHARAARALDAFSDILDHLPKIASSGEEPAFPKTPLWVNLAGWFGVVGVLAFVPTWYFVRSQTRTEDDAPQSIAMLVAIVSGLIASRLARSALRRRLGVPHDGSFARIVFSRIKIFWGAAALVFYAAMLGVLLAHPQ
jgi:hypothetical protein